MMKVDFLLAGTQKGGTTTLDAYLRSHPDICMAKKKEVHFFDNDCFFKEARPEYDQYHSHFPSESQQKNMLYGEATPIHMYWRDAPRRIYQYNPAIKFIIALRNPIERAYSHWNMERARNADTASFIDALHSESMRCQTALPSQHRVFSYVDRGRYTLQLERIYRYFSRKQVLILRSDDLHTKPDLSLKQIYNFLGVQEQRFDEPLHLHARPYQVPIGKDEWSFLRDAFESEIRSLERLTGWSCDEWLHPPTTV